MFATVVNNAGRSDSHRHRQGQRRPAPGRCHGTLGVMILLLCLWSGSALAELIVNEVKSKGLSKSVEVKNTGPGSVNLWEWGCRSSKQSLHPIHPSRVLGPGEVFNFNLNTRSRGDCIELFDSTDVVPDRVFYGDNGGAPQDMEHQELSTIARVDETPDPEGTSSATYWTLDYSGTLGEQNDALPPNLGGAAVKINEIIPGPGSDVLIELFNSTGLPIPLFGWALTSATTLFPLTGILSPGSVQSFNVMDLIFDYGLNTYLMNVDSVRVDQIGLIDAPGDSTTYFDAIGTGYSFQRCPEGSEPYDGYDLESSGYPFTLRLLPITENLLNECQPWPGAIAGAPGTPRRLELRCEPNPFNPSTMIHYSLAQAGQVELAIYDSGGHRVIVLVNGRQSAGPHRHQWNGHGAHGPLSSGVYYLQLRVDGNSRTLKTVLAR